jgi:hydrogenase maturation protease
MLWPCLQRGGSTINQRRIPSVRHSGQVPRSGTQIRNPDKSVQLQYLAGIKRITNFRKTSALTTTDHSILLLCIGNEYRGDDAAGLVVARKVKESPQSRADIIESCGEAASLIEHWRGRNNVVVVDAVSSGAEAGTLYRFDPVKHPFPAECVFSSSHQLGLAHAVELSRTLSILPDRLTVYGIEGMNYTPGAPLTPAVSAASEELGRILVAQLCEP